LLPEVSRDVLNDRLARRAVVLFQLEVVSSLASLVVAEEYSGAGVKTTATAAQETTVDQLVPVADVSESHPRILKNYVNLPKNINIIFLI